jgi:hypothetical protein
MNFIDLEAKAGRYTVQSEPYQFGRNGPPLGLNADVCGATAYHINQLSLEGTEEIEFRKHPF